MTSLTRDAARQRAAQLTVLDYAIELDLTDTERYFGSVTTVRFRAATAAATFVDVAPHRLRAVTLNGTPLDLTGFDPAARRLELTPAAGENVLVVDAEMAYSHDGEGLHRHVDPADGCCYLYATSFLDAAPRWFACFDQPDLKAPVRLEVHCPPDWLVSANGPATQLAPGHWRFAATGLLATYFTTVVAGPYHAVRASHDGIPLVLLSRRSLAAHLEREAAEILAVTRSSFDELHALFGVRYPWGEYHQAFVPEFNAGAMENAGCVTLRDSYVFRSRVTDADRTQRATTIAHEMAHMWFGDLVTMRWWDDLWLNESFAEYLGSRVLGERAWTWFGATRKAWGYAADRRPSTHPVAGNGAQDAAAALTEFDGISYAKGASALRQLAVRLGDDVFLAGLRGYIHAHADGNAQFADLIAAWTAAGARDLDGWSAGWLRTAGLDTLEVAGGAIVRSTDTVPREHAVAVAGYDRGGALLGSRRVLVDAPRTPADVDGLAVPDALDETWAKLRLDWAALPEALPGIAEARTRGAVWNALQLACADAELDPALALRVALQALPAEPDDAVLAAAGRWTERTLLARYLTGAARAAGGAELADAMLRTAHAAPPGSGRQLAAARLLCGVAAQPELLRGWLAGTALPAGLEVDTELRWLIVHRLAELGELDGPAIDDELARDRSSHGTVHATRCRAARPDAAAKAAAWEALMRDPQCPNYELYALAEGFWVPDQSELTDDYVPRYFAEIAATRELRAGFLGDVLAQRCYPWTAVGAGTIAATEALLAEPGLDRGIRRAVLDAGDDLRRAHAVRQRYAA